MFSSKNKPAKEEYRSELTDLAETFQIGVFNDENHAGKVKIRQIGTWRKGIGKNLYSSLMLVNLQICSFLAKYG